MNFRENFKPTKEERIKRYEPIKFEEGRFFPVTKALEYQK